MSKFGRNYKLSIQTNVTENESDIEFLVIEPPFTINFSIVRNNMASANTMTAEVFNLAQSTRSKIFQDRIDPTVYKRVILQAGYNNLSTVFQGNLFSAGSVRRGSEIVTMLDCRDGDYDIRNGQTVKTYAKETANKTILEDLLSSFKYLKKGKVTNVDGNLQRGTVIDENTFYWIKRQQEGVFIDLEKINILKDNEYIAGDVPLITSESGLIGTPQRQNSFLSVTTLFEPRVVIGQLLEIQSNIQKEYNGQYKVIGIEHRGTISSAVGGQLVTKFNLLTQSQLFGQFKEL